MIASGTRLGPYTITAPIGAGGMGEVYKATDTRLDRTVAIKVLPEHVASDTDLKQRFEREAKTLAALSHPHICPVFDVGSQDGIAFLVMEHLEGETLEQRLKKGALPLNQALQVGIQIADALAAAHRAGVVHRDLKPGNVMLTKSGTKLLDFGLAKSGGPVVSGDLSMLPTTVPNLTAQGTILGTFQYMAPEQLEGQEADARTDLFALGAVLYEMVTGKRAFEGKNQASLIVAILERDPVPVAMLQPLTPHALERVIHKCLAKSADERWQTARDLMDELRWVQAAKDANRATAIEQPGRPPRRLAARIAAIVGVASVIAAGVALWGAWRSGTPTAPELLVRFPLFPPNETVFGYNSQFRFAVSPDGRHVAFVADTNSATSLWLHSLESPPARQVPGTTGVRGSPFWSPDSRTLAFFSDGRLHRIDVAGGAPQAVADLPSPLSTTTTVGGSWNNAGTILFAAGPNQPIFHVPAAGGVAKPVTALEPGLQETHAKPSFLPDGRRFLFASTGLPDKAGVWIASLDGGDPLRLLDRATQAAFVERHVVFTRDGLLLAQLFDPEVGQLTGEPQPLGASSVSNLGQFSASQTGRVLAYTGGVSFDFQFTWVDRSGRQLASVLEPARWGNFDLSLDQRYIVTSKGETLGSGDIWSIDLERGVQTRLTFANGLDGSPVWSPDGQRIAFTRGLSNPRIECQAVVIPAAGGNESIAYHSKERGCVILDDWSPDGRFLTFNRDPSLMALPLTGDPKPWPFVQTANANVDESHFSPDGKWIAYSSNESGTWQVYLAPFPPTGERWQISADGGVDVRWRADAQELYYLALDGRMIAVNVRLGPKPALGEPRVLFQSGDNVSVRGDNYAVTNDGRRFLLKRTVTGGRQAIDIVLNWHVGLK